MISTKVLVTWFEMKSKEDFRPKAGYESKIEIIEVNNERYLNYILFLQVGIPYKWYERLYWNDNDWNEYFNKKTSKLFLGMMDKALIGYYEVLWDGDDIELKYFGLFPEYTEKSLGGYFLSSAINNIWNLNPNRIFLQTCDLDNKNAINNYLARGFSIERKKEKYDKIPGKKEFLKNINDFFSKYIDKHRLD